jgi:hypothetical protein
MAQLQVRSRQDVRRNWGIEAQCIQIHQRAEDMSDVVHIHREVYRTSCGPHRVLRLYPVLHIAIYEAEMHT